MRKLPAHIQHWDDERNCDNGIIITLRDGYSFTPTNCGIEHVRGFDTVTAAREGSKLCNVYPITEGGAK